MQTYFTTNPPTQSLVVAGTGDATNESMDLDRVVTVAVAGGFVYFSMLHLTMTLTDGHGAYLNPALTVALISVDLFLQASIRRELIVATITIAFQCMGGWLGSIAARQCVPNPDTGAEIMGISQPNLGTGVYQMWTIELILASFFALVVLSVRCNESRRSSLVISFAFTAVRLIAFPLTGSTMNPARSLGPVASSAFGRGVDYVAVEITAPVCGSCLAAILFYFLNADSLKSQHQGPAAVRAAPGRA